MDNKQLIHIACEGIVIGSVSLYFAKQLKKANKEIEELKEIISKNQAANEKRFEVLFNILDNLNSPQQPKMMVEQPKAPIKKKVTIQESRKEVPRKEAPRKETPKIVQKKVIQEEEEIPENSTQIEEEDDEVIDLEEETRSLLEEDVEEDIEA